MRISSEWEKLCAYRKTKRVSFLSLREALKILAWDSEEGKNGLHPVLFSASSPEWYTDELIINSTRKVLGTIDLDPCSDPDRRIPARRHFTAEDDGLSQSWEGRVYLNPPYGRDLAEWIRKLREEYPRAVKEAILLLPSRTDTEFFAMLAEFASCFCFIRGRLTFSGHENAAPFPSLIAYVGERTPRFASTFSKLGALFVPYRT
jgi:hypothetical protein